MSNQFANIQDMIKSLVIAIYTCCTAKDRPQTYSSYLKKPSTLSSVPRQLMEEYGGLEIAHKTPVEESLWGAEEAFKTLPIPSKEFCWLPHWKKLFLHLIVRVGEQRDPCNGPSYPIIIPVTKESKIPYYKRPNNQGFCLNWNQAVATLAWSPGRRWNGDVAAERRFAQRDSSLLLLSASPVHKPPRFGLSEQI